ncbi:lytic transglycosylase domain-containing protein [Biformimicrobium ophioploci]|nr:transglycosylase SLT domain-containing protein [Microbulbifer sp. NKW57]
MRRLRTPLLAALLLSTLFSNPLHANERARSIDRAGNVDDSARLALLSAMEDPASFEDKYDAQVWLMAKSAPLERYIKDPERRMHILKAVHREATRAGVSPEMVLAVIQIESAFDPYAISRVGARGIMQVMPFWKHEIGRPDDNLMNLETNLRYGCAILKHYIEKAKGNMPNALAYYNGSYGRHTYSSKVLDAWANRWR